MLGKNVLSYQQGKRSGPGRYWKSGRKGHRDFPNGVLQKVFEKRETGLGGADQ